MTSPLYKNKNRMQNATEVQKLNSKLAITNRLLIEQTALKEYQKKCAEIDNEEETEIIHNGKKYRLVEE